MAVDMSSIKRNDLGALVAGGLVFVLSLMPAWITVDFEGSGADLFTGFDTGINAWHSYNVLALLLLLLATAVVAVRVFAPQVIPSGMSVGTGVIAAALAVVGTLLMLLRTLTLFESESAMGVEFSQGPGWSGWLLLVAAIALTTFTALNFRDSGEPLPWKSAGSAGHQPPPAGDEGTPPRPPV